MNKLFTAIVHRGGDLYVAECPEVGTASQGSSIENAIDNLQESTALYLEEFPLTETQHPFSIKCIAAYHTTESSARNATAFSIRICARA